jgi:hypothetical protein
MTQHYDAINSALVLTVGPSTGWVSMRTAARSRLVRHSRSASWLKVRLPSG